jgi:hypothetical protein
VSKLPRSSGVQPGTHYKSPEAVGKITVKHVRVLERMLNHRLGKAAMFMGTENKASDFLLGEIGALSSAIATCNEIIAARQEKP